MNAANLVAAIEGPRLSIPLGLVRRLGGDLGTAAFLAQAAYLSALLQSDGGGDGFFFLAQTGDPGEAGDGLFAALGSWEAALGMTPAAQLVARRKLIERGLLEERKAGIPARLHYRVDSDKYLAFLAGKPINEPLPPDSQKPGNLLPGNQEACLSESEKQDSGKTRTYIKKKNKRKNKKMNSSSTTPEPAQDGGVDAAAPSSDFGARGGGKRRRVRASKIVTWDDSDTEEALRIEADHDKAAIADAIAALAEVGKEPVPGRVEREIQQATRKREAEARQAEQRAAAETTHRADIKVNDEAIRAGRAMLEKARTSRMAVLGALLP